MLITLLIIALSMSHNANAKKEIAYSSNIEEAYVSTSLSVDEQIKSNNAYFIKWLKNETKTYIGNYNLEPDNYKAVLELRVSKEGKILEYKIDHAENVEFKRFLSEILEDAPSFEPIKMNGFAAKMSYEIPVSVFVR